MLSMNNYRVKLQSILKSTRPSTWYREYMYLTYPSLINISIIVVVYYNFQFSRSLSCNIGFFCGSFNIKSHKIIITMGKFAKRGEKLHARKNLIIVQHEPIMSRCLSCVLQWREQRAGSVGGICAVHKCIIKIKCMMDCNYIEIVAV